VVSKTCNVAIFHIQKKLWTIALTIKNNGKAVTMRILQHFFLGCLGKLLFQPRDNILFQNFQQTRIDGLVDNQERLGIPGIDPVIGGRPQTKFLSGNEVTRQIGLFTMINTHMTVNIERSESSFQVGHPVRT